MRYTSVLSTAVSVLALGVITGQATALSPGADGPGSERLVQMVQRGDDKGGPAARSPNGGGKKDAAPSAREGAGDRPRAGTSQDAGQAKGGERGAAQDRGERGAQMGGGEKGARNGQRRTNVDVDVRGGSRDRGRADRRRTDIDVDVRGDRGYRADRRDRVDIDVDRRRRSGGRDVDINVRGYGYGPTNCQDILRRYRQCVAR